MPALCPFLLSYFPAQINSDPCSYDPDLCTEPVSALSVSQHVLNVPPPVTVRRLRCPAVALVWQVFIPTGVEEGGGEPLWIFCIIKYLRDATSRYLHWTDGNVFRAAHESTDSCVRLLMLFRNAHSLMLTHDTVCHRTARTRLH